jgi:hypothetical protein
MVNNPPVFAFGNIQASQNATDIAEEDGGKGREKQGGEWRCQRDTFQAKQARMPQT